MGEGSYGTLEKDTLTDKDMAELFNPDNLIRVLEDLANDVRDNYKAQLELHDRIASGDLINKVKTEVEVNGTVYSVWLTDLQDYWKYVENGSAPHWPPKEAIDRWIQIKPVIPHPDKNGRLPTPEQLSFLIRRKISIEGTEGSHDLKKAEDAVLPAYEERLLEALQRDALNYIEKVLP